MLLVDGDSRIAIYADRNLQPGNEITYDYGSVGRCGCVRMRAFVRTCLQAQDVRVAAHLRICRVRPSWLWPSRLGGVHAS